MPVLPLLISAVFLSEAFASVEPPSVAPDTLTIAAVGDVLLHSPLQKQAYETPEGFQKLWRPVTPLLRAADLSYANLEGPAAGAIDARGRPVKDPGLHYDGKAYSGYPTFNYHPKIAAELKRAGFSVVSTANNHAMDRASPGVDRTIGALREAGLAFTGTRTAADARADEGDFSWHVVTKARGWRVAWIACTFSTNGIRDPHRQVLRCFEDADLVESEIRALRRDPRVDAVIVTPHWGEVEYRQTVEHGQRTLARRFAEAGATALIGNHPHVTKPSEKIVTKDGREVYVVYSIGNFVSAQGTLAERTSALIYLRLSRKPGTKAKVSSVSYVPLYMQKHPYTVAPAENNANAPAASIRLLETMLGKEGRVRAKASGPFASR